MQVKRQAVYIQTKKTWSPLSILSGVLWRVLYSDGNKSGAIVSHHQSSDMVNSLMLQLINKDAAPGGGGNQKHPSGRDWHWVQGNRQNRDLLEWCEAAAQHDEHRQGHPPLSGCAAFLPAERLGGRDVARVLAARKQLAPLCEAAVCSSGPSAAAARGAVGLPPTSFE